MEDAASHTLHIDAVRRHLHNKLKVSTLQGVTIKALDNALQNRDDWALDGFFLWLHDQLGVWSRPEPDVYQPKIQSFYDRLRNRHQDDKRIIEYFQLWKSIQPKIDPSIQPRVTLVEYLVQKCYYRRKKRAGIPSSHPPVRQSPDPAMDRPSAKLPDKPMLSVHTFPEKAHSKREYIATMRKREVVENSSGGEDSEVELLGTKTRNDRAGHKMRQNETKPSFPSSPVSKGAQKIVDVSYKGDHPPFATDTRGSRNENKVDTPNKSQYICNRCHKPGKADWILTP